MSNPKLSQQPPIAVVGVGGIFPGAVDIQAFWQNIVTGADLITDIPATHWRPEHYFDADPKRPDMTYAKRGAFLPPVPFDPVAFGMPPSLLSSTDTSQLLGLLVARTTLADATQNQLDSIDRSRISVLLGVTSGQELFGQMAARLAHPHWRAGMRAAGIEEEQVEAAMQKISSSMVPWTEATFPGLLGNVVAGRIANRLDLGGTNAVTDAACASSFAAISMGIDELLLGRADLVLTGGVDTLNDIFMYMCFSKTPALSASGDCRPFDEKADGTLLGEGLGMLALKRLEDAERDGDAIYALIRGLGTSSDGRSKSVYAPVSEGQAQALRRAYERAQYSPATVELVEAHGTGTKAGDVAEVGGLKQCFTEAATAEGAWAALGSVKSQIGHTKAAAGAAGLLKVVMSLHHKVLPPTIKVDRPNPKLGLDDSPFYLNSVARPWIRGGAHPRRASVSSFGFGGSNFHITVEEYQGNGKRPPNMMRRPVEVFSFSSSSEADLEAKVSAFRARVTTDAADRSLAELAKTTQDAFTSSDPHRAAFVAASTTELRARLDRLGRLLETPVASRKNVPGIYLGSGAPIGKLACLFPGQGSQYVDMGRDAAIHFAEVRKAFDAANDIPLANTPLSSVVFPPPAFDEEKRANDARTLTQTQWAQPALGVLEAGMLAQLQRCHVEPQMYAGHSFGEISALYAAGAFSFADMVRLARRRGELMANASERPGAMAAIAGDLATIREVVDTFPATELVMANENAPTQAVISGTQNAVREAQTQLAERGLRGKELDVATAFHSPLVAEACEPFAEFLGSIAVSPLQSPVYANETAEPYQPDAASIRRQLATQIGKPVRFVDEIEAMYAAGARIFLEVGPGTVLSGLVNKILEGRPHLTISSNVKSKNSAQSLLECFAQIQAAGLSIDLSSLWQDAPQIAEAPPARAMQVDVSGANLGKPALPVAKTPPPSVRPPLRETDRPALSPRLAPPKAQPPVMPKSPQTDSPGTTMTSSNPKSPATLSRSLVSSAQPVLPAPEWIDVFREGQRQAADAHATFQKSMAEAHVAFLQTFEASAKHLTSVLSPDHPQRVPVDLVPAQETPPRGELGNPAGSAAPQSVPTAAGWTPDLRMAPMDPAPPVPTRTPSLPPPPNTVRQDSRWSGVAATSSHQTVDLEQVFLDVVADKTGYPKEALSLDMSLEADLGIDSIKRVEILGALRDQAPALPEIDAMQMAQLTTLGAISAHLQHLRTDSATTTTDHGRAPLSSLTGATPQDAHQVLMSVVAEKTGYPQEALSFDMHLEADLGIDSIKRVEILGAFRDKMPSAPELDAMKLAQLSTLGAIAEALSSSLHTTSLSSSASVGTSQPVSQPGERPTDVTQSFLHIVAEKTGYPLEALHLDMALEADLGVDSIKRVEILGAMRETHPDLPELDAMKLAQLATLREIAQAMNSTPAPLSTPIEDKSASWSVDAAQVADTFLEVVAEKTGYPKEALHLDMGLEGDLGIDSIKRVEILGAMKERMTHLPNIDAMKLAQLNTLGEVAQALVATRDNEEAVPLPFADGAIERKTLSVAPLAPTHIDFSLPTGARVLMVPDQMGIASLLAERLRARGLKVSLVESKSDVAELDDIAGLIHLGTLSTADQATTLHTLRSAFDITTHVARQLQDKGAQGGALYVTVQNTGGDFGLHSHEASHALSGALAGLTKTAAQEWPDVYVKALDVNVADVEPDELAMAIDREVFSGHAVVEAGLVGPAEWVGPLLSPAPLAPASHIHLGPEDVLVATGGARGVTAASLEALCRSTRSRLVLLGRTDIKAGIPEECVGLQQEADIKRALFLGAQRRGEPLTPAEIGRRTSSILAVQEIQEQLKRFASQGTDARYYAVDVRDAGALHAALQDARSHFGPITGLVHGAGVLADRRIEDKSLEQYDLVWNTKVGGLLALMEALASDPLRVVCLFSSVAGRFGNVGQSDYAMANEALNKLAHVIRNQRGSSCIVKSLNWGPWEGGMVTPELKRRFQERGVEVLSLRQGARFFIEELSESSPHETVEVIFGSMLLPADSQEKRASSVSRDRASSPARSTATHETPKPFRIRSAAHQQLIDHSLGGFPVLPTVFAIELLVDAALAKHPDLALQRVDDLRVIRGVRLSHFQSHGNELRVELEPLSTSGESATSYQARLVTPGERAPHFSAKVHLAGQVAPLVERASNTDLTHYGHSIAEVYDQLLFHGPQFQLIQEIEGLTREGMVASIVGLQHAKWPETGILGQGWRLDPAALDAGLQLLLLYARHAVGGAFLPTGIGSVQTVVNGALPSPLRVQLQEVEHSADRVVADLDFIDDQGRVVAQLVAATAHRLLDEAAFHRSKASFDAVGS